MGTYARLRSTESRGDYMSPLTLMIGALLILSGCGSGQEEPSRQGHAEPDKVLWARSDLYEGKPISLVLPNRIMKLDYGGRGKVVINGRGQTVRLEVVPPASVLWRPDGNAVAINNGNGSGQISDLIIVGNHSSVFAGVSDQLKSYFFRQTGCRPDPEAVSVSAEGWSTDSSTLWVRFESWDRQALCNSDQVTFGQYDFTRRSVISHLSLVEAMAVFCRDKEFRELYSPNCKQQERESRANSGDTIHN